mmetsp:Transcript_23408/g.52803  ORF Transcript_23408/g.52803 Transcript_23408/m.52803 type:complete len:313 (+) Transcript_23408:185-1123(+)
MLPLESLFENFVDPGYEHTKKYSMSPESELYTFLFKVTKPRTMPLTESIVTIDHFESMKNYEKYDPHFQDKLASVLNVSSNVTSKLKSMFVPKDAKKVLSVLAKQDRAALKRAPSVEMSAKEKSEQPPPVIVSEEILEERGETNSSANLRQERAVACCFVGQFLRGAQVVKSARAVFAKAPRNLAFDAFISMATQRTEIDASNIVNGAELCNVLLLRGFRNCSSNLKQYNGSAFVEATRHLGFRSDTLFHHRTASFFSTISRCMAEVRQSPLADTYQTILSTRLDLWDHLHVRDTRSLFKFDVIGKKEQGAS